MLRALIIEDEAPARTRLADLLAKMQPPVAIAGTADSVRSAAVWLRAHPAPELIFADIQLGDGLSLELFRSTPPPCPIIFTTAYDDYLLEAFGAHGIAYLLKPVKPADLAAALQKYRTLGAQFAASLASLAGQLLAPAGVAAKRHRLLAQRGTTFQPVAIADVAYFFSENKLTFLVTRTGEKCLINEPLATLEGELDAREFFRLNRNFLAHVSAVKSFSSVGKGRLSVQLAPRSAEEVIVSQERGADFRAWAGA
ncbi:MAG: DNA-binding response regulator [Opitutus sp.]|nr:DNA-binding response regulator [Opitutus sp.]